MRDDITQLARGQWSYIHPALGIPPEWMTKTGKPCLMCGGHDRSHYDDKDGRGTYLCRQCGAGDGFTLLQRYHGWTFKQTADEVRRALGAEKPEYTPRPVPKPEPPTSKTQGLALRLWEAAREKNVSSHTYARKKRIRSDCGARRGIVTGSLVGNAADCLIVPSRTITGEVVGIEAINPQGVKQSYGKKSLLILGNDLDSGLPIVIVEGFATAVNYLNSRKWNGCAVVSFGKGRLQRVSEEIEAHYPNHTVLIAEEQD